MWHFSHLVFLIALLLPDYAQNIEDARRERDQLFSEPLTSPLAQEGGALLQASELVFGSSPGAQLHWKGDGVRSRHLRISRQEDGIFLEPLEGTVFDVQTGEKAGRRKWEPDRMYQAGPVILVLREHPAGPIVRILDPNSPKVRQFKGLHYFPVDEKYRVKATIHPHPLRRIRISDTQGWERPAWLYGKLAFSVDEVPQQLDLILFGEEADKDSGFLLMFSDQTSGDETYPACRYLHLPFQSEGDLWLDFNEASNPYCAYSSSFACPLPPSGNRISTPIRAGEKMYFKEHH